MERGIAFGPESDIGLPGSSCRAMQTVLVSALWIKRKQFSAFFRDEIRCTISDSADVDAEQHDLCEALIAAEGRIMP
jgi:hypothetical protein